jgi:hypothetical protein
MSQTELPITLLQSPLKSGVELRNENGMPDEERLKKFLKDLKNFSLDSGLSDYIKYVRITVLMIHFKDLFLNNKEFLEKFLEK